MDEGKNFSFSEIRRNYVQPYPLDTALRESDSIFWDATSQCWLVTAYAPVVAILHDPRFSSALDTASSLQLPSVHKQMLFMDGEAHQQAQSVLLHPLAQMAKKMPEIIRRSAETIVQQASARGEFDVVQDFSSVISLVTISQVLGIPTNDMALLRQLDQWSDTFGDVTSGYFRGRMQEIRLLEDYFRRNIATKRQEPGDDLISAFLMAGDVFTEEELIANCMMVFTAGRITTEKLLGDGIPLLADIWPQARARYLTESASLPRSMGEELLRVVTPTRYVMRQALTDVDFSEQFPSAHVIHQRDKVLLSQVGSLQLKPGSAPIWNPTPNLGEATSQPLLVRGVDDSSSPRLT